jgi:hypothetical protein
VRKRGRSGAVAYWLAHVKADTRVYIERLSGLRIALLLGPLEFILVEQIVSTHFTLGHRRSGQSSVHLHGRAQRTQLSNVDHRFNVLPLSSASFQMNTFPERSCPCLVDDNCPVINRRVFGRTAPRMICTSRASQMSTRGHVKGKGKG